MFSEPIQDLIEAALTASREAIATPENPWPSFEETWEHARDAEPKLFAAESSKSVDKVRPETLAKILERRTAADPSPYQQLLNIATAIRKRDAVGRREAMQRAIEQHPLLFQQWQDSLPTGELPEELKHTL